MSALRPKVRGVVHVLKLRSPPDQLTVRDRDRQTQPLNADSVGTSDMRTPRSKHLQHWPMNRVTGSPGQWVIWVIFSVWVTGSPGHICDPVGDPNIFNFSNFRTNAQNAQLTF